MTEEEEECRRLAIQNKYNKIQVGDLVMFKNNGHWVRDVISTLAIVIDKNNDYDDFWYIWSFELNRAIGTRSINVVVL